MGATGKTHSKLKQSVDASFTISRGAADVRLRNLLFSWIYLIRRKKNLVSLFHKSTKYERSL